MEEFYNEVKPNAKSRDYRSSLFWLAKCGLAYEVNRIALPHYPLVSYAESEHFKLYMFDIGLLSAMTNLDIEAFLDRDPSVFDHFYGALAEQKVIIQDALFTIFHCIWLAIFSR